MGHGWHHDRLQFERTRTCRYRHSSLITFDCVLRKGTQSNWSEKQARICVACCAMRSAHSFFVVVVVVIIIITIIARTIEVPTLALQWKRVAMCAAVGGVVIIFTFLSGSQHFVERRRNGANRAAPSSAGGDCDALLRIVRGGPEAPHTVTNTGRVIWTCASANTEI